MERIHHVSCSMHSDDYGTADFDRVEKMALKIRNYAEKLGFGVMYENVDTNEGF